MTDAKQQTRDTLKTLEGNHEGYELTLECGDIVYVRVKLKYTYPDDEHYVYCQKCKYLKGRDPYGRPPSAWSKVVYQRGVTDEFMSNVLSSFAFNLPADILRLQPSVPSNRVRPFPYVTRRIT